MDHGRTAYVILGLLAIEPDLSGYDIRKAVEGSLGYFWGESYGQIYPSLKRLAAEGLIRPSGADGGGARRRQLYALTEAGRARLREWLAAPFQNDPPRNEFLLKLFFGREAGPGVSIAHVQALNEKNRAMLAALLDLETFARAQDAPAPDLDYWLLTLDLGIALTRAALDWGDATLAKLATMEAAPEPGRDARTIFTGGG